MHMNDMVNSAYNIAICALKVTDFYMKLFDDLPPLFN